MGNYSTPDGEVDNTQSRTGMMRLGGSWTGEHSYAGASYAYSDLKYGLPFIEEGNVSLTPRRHAFNIKAGGTALPGFIQSYRATLGVRRYQHTELEGDEIGTQFKNDQLEGEVLLSHRKTAGMLGSVGGWLLNRQFEASGAEALSPPVDQNTVAAFLYEEVAWPHATLQFGGRMDHTRYAPQGVLPNRDFTEFSGSVGLLLRPAAANDNFVIAASVARAARAPALEELYFFGPHIGNVAYEIGNPDLQAERALGLDVALRVRGRRFEGEISFFRNSISNFISATRSATRSSRNARRSSTSASASCTTITRAKSTATKRRTTTTARACPSSSSSGATACCGASRRTATSRSRPS